MVMKVKIYKNAKGLAKHVETCKKNYDKQKQQSENVLEKK